MMGSLATKIPYRDHVRLFPKEAQDVMKGKALVDCSFSTTIRTAKGEPIIKTDSESPIIPTSRDAPKHPNNRTTRIVSTDA